MIVSKGDGLIMGGWEMIGLERSWSFCRFLEIYRLTQETSEWGDKVQLLWFSHAVKRYDLSDSGRLS